MAKKAKAKAKESTRIFNYYLLLLGLAMSVAFLYNIALRAAGGRIGYIQFDDFNYLAIISLALLLYGRYKSGSHGEQTIATIGFTVLLCGYYVLIAGLF